MEGSFWHDFQNRLSLDVHHKNGIAESRKTSTHTLPKQQQKKKQNIQKE
jgi:hypothetical protein